MPPTERDPDVIKRAPSSPTVNASSEVAASEEAAAAEADARTGRAEFRSTLGRFASAEEIKLAVGSVVVLAGFAGLIAMMVWMPDMRQAAWSLLVAIVTGAVALVFGSKIMGGND